MDAKLIKDFVEVKPTLDGYRNMARLFAEQLIDSDAKTLEARAVILRGLLDIIRYLSGEDEQWVYKFIQEISA